MDNSHVKYNYFDIVDSSFEIILNISLKLAFFNVF